MNYTNAKIEEERIKIAKEMRLYPWIAIFFSIIISVAMIVAPTTK